MNIRAQLLLPWGLGSGQAAPRASGCSWCRSGTRKSGGWLECAVLSSGQRPDAPVVPRPVRVLVLVIWRAALVAFRMQRPHTLVGGEVHTCCRIKPNLKRSGTRRQRSTKVTAPGAPKTANASAVMARPRRSPRCSRLQLAHDGPDHR